MQQLTLYAFFQDREATSQRILRETSNSYLIPPFDHPHIIAGQGTLGLEILEQVFVVFVLFCSLMVLFKIIPIWSLSFMQFSTMYSFAGKLSRAVGLNLQAVCQEGYNEVHSCEPF